MSNDEEKIIDSCSLINLVSGWGGFEELKDLKLSLHICEVVAQESEFVREYDSEGRFQPIPLDLTKAIADSVLVPVKLDSAEELAAYVDFATEIDDGEAQALAIALHRGYVLLTDDRKALSMAARPEVGVKTLSTVGVLERWAKQDAENEARLPEVIRRIEELAKFAPKKGTPEAAWWAKYRS